MKQNNSRHISPTVTGNTNDPSMQHIRGSSINTGFPDYDLEERKVVTAPHELRAIAGPFRGILLDLLIERAATVSELALIVGAPGGRWQWLIRTYGRCWASTRSSNQRCGDRWNGTDGTGWHAHRV
jgi:hypothetical protein